MMLFVVIEVIASAVRHHVDKRNKKAMLEHSKPCNRLEVERSEYKMRLTIHGTSRPDEHQTRSHHLQCTTSDLLWVPRALIIAIWSRLRSAIMTKKLI
jgi:hypothetical protein